MAGLTARLGSLERTARARLVDRFKAAGHAQRATMAPEHVRIAEEWHASPEVRADWLRHPRDPWPARLERLQPPALVRAMYWLVFRHLDTGAPSDLPPHVAAVYVDDPDAWPVAEFRCCGYPAPVRIRWGRGGQPEVALAYFEECPLCDDARPLTTKAS